MRRRSFLGFTFLARPTLLASGWSRQKVDYLLFSYKAKTEFIPTQNTSNKHKKGHHVTYSTILTPMEELAITFI